MAPEVYATAGLTLPLYEEVSDGVFAATSGAAFPRGNGGSKAFKRNVDHRRDEELGELPVEHPRKTQEFLSAARFAGLKPLTFSVRVLRPGVVPVHRSKARSNNEGQNLLERCTSVPAEERPRDSSCALCWLSAPDRAPC